MGGVTTAKRGIVWSRRSLEDLAQETHVAGFRYLQQTVQDRLFAGFQFPRFLFFDTGIGMGARRQKDRQTTGS
jgi:hypothetical protein